MQDKSKIHTEDEIDLIEVVKSVWENRRMVIKVTIVSILVGLFVAIFSKTEYQASTTIVPQSSEEKNLGGGLGGLAALAGVDLGGLGGSDIPPSLYPEILESTPFQKEMLQTALSIEGQEQKVSFEYYYKELYTPSLLENIRDYTIGLPRIIINAIRGEDTDEAFLSEDSNLITISLEEQELIDILEENLWLEVNDKEGYVSLSAYMPEATAAAQLVLHAQELLQEAITNFKIQKTQDQLVFVNERFNEKQKEFREVQQQLAEFNDRNKNVITAEAQLERERLQSNYELIYGVYSELAKELETKKIQVKENTPVFTIIQPVTVPIEKSKPRRALILVVSAILGAILGVVGISVQWLIRGVKDSWNKDEQEVVN